jgi:hypothetical protein
MIADQTYNQIDANKLAQIMSEPSTDVAFARLRKLLEKYLSSVHLAIERGDIGSLQGSMAMLEEVAKLTEFEELLFLSDGMHTASFEKNWLQCKVLLATMQQTVITATSPQEKCAPAPEPSAH